LLVKEIMTKDVISFKPDDSLISVANKFIEKHISAGPVVDAENRVVGVISESDLMKILEYHKDLGAELLSLIPLFGNQWSFQRDLGEFNKWALRVEEGKVKDEMSKDVFTVHFEDVVAKAVEIMVYKKVNHIPVVDDENKLVGIVARADVVRAMSKEA